MRNIRIILLICQVVLIASNSSIAQDKQSMKNVKIVHNDKRIEQNKVDISLELVKNIGSLDDGDSNNTFNMPRDVAVDKEGNILVLDSGEHRIQKFNKDGEFIKSIGRKGQGPGEFSTRPESIDVDNDNNILVAENGGKRLTKLSKEGDYITHFLKKISCSSYKALSSNKVVGNFTPWHGMILLLKSPTKPPPVHRVLSIFNMEGKILSEFGRVKDFGNNLLTRKGNISQLATDSSNNIYVSFAYQNRIEKFSPEGTLEMRIDRHLGYKISANIVKREEGPNSRSFESPEITPVSSGIAIDHMNRIWVATYKNHDKRVRNEWYKNIVFEIFNSDGILICCIPVPRYFTRFRIFNDRLYLVDGLETCIIYEYKIK